MRQVHRDWQSGTENVNEVPSPIEKRSAIDKGFYSTLGLSAGSFGDFKESRGNSVFSGVM